MKQYQKFLKQANFYTLHSKNCVKNEAETSKNEWKETEKTSW